MKKSANLLLVLTSTLLSMNAFSIDSNYDISSQILSIPGLVIKNDSTESRYKDTRLLLNSDGTWKILNLDAKPSPYYPKRKQLTGHWVGKSSSFPGNICISGSGSGSTSASWRRIGDYTVALMQHNDQLVKDELTGIVVGVEPCTWGVVGKLTGKVTDDHVFFTVEFNGEEYIEFEGKASSDFSKIDGEITYKQLGTTYSGEKDSLSLSLQ